MPLSIAEVPLSMVELLSSMVELPSLGELGVVDGVVASCSVEEAPLLSLVPVVEFIPSAGCVWDVPVAPSSGFVPVS
ncbi:hypothetical protein [Pleomorphomonas sp. NRK KF1]|uniref:hypothetical protein n=1 Tax=Pleomorphomonas sp. NRK KF1 TaxID=2943000 RepID=UPI0020433B2A|nr:hypothetical protein [Pleomorphomonas sp. NRK KF1]MCM5552599.1 hypothetical protein [Pleomorphomonas sp. NRK KF1]